MEQAKDSLTCLNIWTAEASPRFCSSLKFKKDSEHAIRCKVTHIFATYLWRSSRQQNIKLTLSIDYGRQSKWGEK